MSDKVDVLICGSGSAGLCAALWLSRYGISYKLLERRAGPLDVGQADGVQCRTVEIFDSFGIASDLLAEAYHVLELAFWSSADRSDGGIARSHFAPDKQTELSHQPHVILNQARLNDIMLDELKRAGEPPIVYGVEVKSVDVDSEAAGDPDAYCVRVAAVKDGVEEVHHAKYVLGCDGAHSVVRKSLGFKMIGDSSDSIWGVTDVYPRTNFPDIRKKAIINSDAGNLMIIPREGQSLARFYIELPAGTKVSDVQADDIHDRARLILKPYTLEVAETAWWSAYSIGQRRADFFTKDHRVFLTGDACHTHSPKAGQGMNVSLQDGYNLGWKLGAVLAGQAGPDLLRTYVTERESTATELIDFDRYFTQLFSSKYRQDHGITPEHFAEQFVRAGRYTAGQAIKYGASAITVPGQADDKLAAKTTVGMRFPSAQVVRFCDARAMQLQSALPADCRWHVLVFAGDIRHKGAAARLDEVAKSLDGVARRFTAPGADPDSVIDPVLVLSGKRTEVEQAQIPDFFTPVTGKWKMKCLHKVFVDDESYNSGHGHAYDEYGIDPKVGALVVVRPDQYTAKVCALEEVGEIGDFFGMFLCPSRGC